MVDFMGIGNLGSDNVSDSAIIYLVIMSIALVGLGGFAVNFFEVQQVALIYLTLASAALIIWTVSKVISSKKDIDFPNPPIFEKDTIFGFSIPPKIYAIMIAGIAIAAVWTFTSIGNIPQFSIVAAPQFQAIELTAGFNVLLTIFAAMAEDILFFIVIPAISFVIFYSVINYFSNNSGVSTTGSVIITLLVSALVFTAFHSARYGFALAQTSESVFIFGFIMTLWVILTKNPLLPWFIHSANNAGLAYFTDVGRFDTTGIFIFSTLAILILLGAVLYALNKKGV